MRLNVKSGYVSLTLAYVLSFFLAEWATISHPLGRAYVLRCMSWNPFRNLRSICSCKGHRIMVETDTFSPKLPYRQYLYSNINQCLLQLKSNQPETFFLIWSKQHFHSEIKLLDNLTRQLHFEHADCKYGDLCGKQVSRVGLSNYIQPVLWDIILCPYLHTCFLHPILHSIKMDLP